MMLCVLSVECFCKYITSNDLLSSNVVFNIVICCFKCYTQVSMLNKLDFGNIYYFSATVLILIIVGSLTRRVKESIDCRIQIDIVCYCAFHSSFHIIRMSRNRMRSKSAAVRLASSLSLLFQPFRKLLIINIIVSKCLNGSLRSFNQ